MKLFLFSGGTPESNLGMDLAFLAALGDLQSARVLFVPSEPRFAESDYAWFRRHYSFADRALLKTGLLMPDAPITEDIAKWVGGFTAIYLGGGNTFRFLYHLRATGLFELLLAFVARGGVLAGQSAGAILMTPTIGTAAFPDFDRDENDVGLAQISSLDLVSFEFFPHYVNRPRYSREMRRYTRSRLRPLYAVADGGGIIYEQESRRLSFFGEVWAFAGGKRYRLNPP